MLPVLLGDLAWLPWVPEVFSTGGGNTFSAEGRTHERCKDMTETGNRARKVSGTQGMAWQTDANIRVLTAEVAKNKQNL